MITSFLKDFLSKNKEKIPAILKVLVLFIEDIFVFLGLFFIVKATFMWNEVVGVYSIGVVLILIGLMLIRKPSPRRR